MNSLEMLKEITEKIQVNDRVSLKEHDIDNKLYINGVLKISKIVCLNSTVYNNRVRFSDDLFTV